MKRAFKTNYLQLLLIFFTLINCGGPDDELEVKVTNVSLDKTDMTLTIGETDNLIATVSPSNAKASIVWESNNDAVVTVDNNGILKAVSAGTASVKASTKDQSYSASCYVTVVYPGVSGVQLDYGSITLHPTETKTLVATVLPVNAQNKSVTWTSSNASIATVSNNGLVEAKSVGEATITVTTAEGSYTATCQVKVESIAVTGVTLNKTSLSLTAGNTSQLTATVSPSNATNQSVTWSSSNSTIASVNSSGLISAIKPGTATITVKTSDGNYTASCTVTVSGIAVTSISVSPTSLILEEGDIYFLSATVSPSNATNKNVVWSSSNSVLVSVTQDGKISVDGLKGSATITATSQDNSSIKGTCTVKVLLPIDPLEPLE